jgi:replication fork clamp-binding protein CrfC
MPTEEDSFYMAVRNPKDFRRELLNSNKQILQLLQKNEDLKGLRIKKIELMFKYNDIISEINMLMSKLKRTIPQTKLRNIPEIKNKEEKEAAAPKKEKIIYKAEKKNELVRLQQELEQIESKLGKLNSK